MDLAHFSERLDKNSIDTLELAKACRPEQLTFRQENEWSILEILEHICITDKIIYGMVSRPSDNMHWSSDIIGDEKMKKLVVELRKHKVESPERLKPKGDIQDIVSFEKLFLKQRELLKEEIQTGKIALDNRVHRHLFLGEMTISDWLNFIIHHTQRHMEQIKDILREKMN